MAFKYSGHAQHRRLAGAALLMSYHWAGDWVHRRRQRSQSHHRAVMWGGKQSRMGTVWVVGWEQAGSRLCWAMDPTFPSHTQWAGSKWALVLGQKTHTGQQIMPDVNHYCLNVGWVSSFLQLYKAKPTFTPSYFQPSKYLIVELVIAPMNKQPQNPGSFRAIELPCNVT